MFKNWLFDEIIFHHKPKTIRFLWCLSCCIFVLIFCFVRLAKCSICYILLASQRKKIKTKIQHQRYQRNRIKNKKDTQPNTVLDFFDTFIVVFWFWFFGVVRLAKCSKCYILLTSQSKKIKTKIQQQRYQRNRTLCLVGGVFWFTWFDFFDTFIVVFWFWFFALWG